MKSLQITIGASATQVSTTDIPCKQIIFQKATANTCRVGDVNVSTTRGILLLASGVAGSAVTIGPFDTYAENLKDWWIAGTQNDVVEVLFLQ